MRFQGRLKWGVFLTFLMFMAGCGDLARVDEEEGNSSSPALRVRGSALFGSQCALTGVPSQLVQAPLDIWDCPMPVRQVELEKSLEAIILQADCKKKTLDVRPMNQEFRSKTWEVMPDGNFSFVMNVGHAVLKTDGKGNTSCSVPLKTQMWGRVECQTQDKAIIHVQSIWWLGQSYNDPEDSAPRPSGVPSGVPSPIPSAAPSGVPSPRPSLQLSSHSVGEPSGSTCQLPTGAQCYFHNISHIKQCF